MAIEVIDNFVVNVEKPIDNRFVVGPQSFYTDKDSIPYKYEGLRIWDLNDSQPYVWTGSAWSNESGVGNLSGLGTGGYFSKYVGGVDSSQLTNSVVFELSSNVIIGGTTNPDSDKLRVVGSIRATGNIIGNGSQITSINASNISTGTLSINRLQNGTTSQLLVAGVSSPTWINSSSVTVGNSDKIKVNNITNNTDNGYLSFLYNNSGYQDISVSDRILFSQNSAINILPGYTGTSRFALNGRIEITGSDLTVPISINDRRKYTIYSNISRGVYHASNRSTDSVNGNKLPFNIGWIDSTAVGFSTIANYDSNQPSNTIGSSSNTNGTTARSNSSSRFRNRIVFDIRYDIVGGVYQDGSYGTFLITNTGRHNSTPLNQCILVSFSKGYNGPVSGELSTLLNSPLSPDNSDIGRLPGLTIGNYPFKGTGVTGATNDNSRRIILNIASSESGAGTQARQTINVIQIGGIGLGTPGLSIINISFARSADQNSGTEWDYETTVVPFSDIQLKENIELIGISGLGINIYEFNYIGETDRYIGVIAQELIGTQFENALVMRDGYYSVDYSKIDVEFKKV